MSWTDTLELVVLLWFELVEIDACIFGRIGAILEEIPFLIAHDVWVQNNARHLPMPIALHQN